MQSNSTTPTIPTATPSSMGPALSILGNFCISLGFQIQKMAHTHTLRHLLWWCGCVLMVLGEGSNFTAYGMAPASIVAPLDAVAIVSNVMLSRILLKERLSRAGITGLVLALAGIVAVALNAPRTETSGSVEDTVNGIVSFQSMVFLSTACGAALWVANPWNHKIGVSFQAKRLSAIYYCLLCGCMGTLTMVSAKGISTILHHALDSGDMTLFDDPKTCWLAFILLTTAVASAAIQIKYLHIAFNEFGASLVVSMYYAIFTCLAVGAGMIIFHETSFSTSKHPALFGCGIVLTYAGVYAVGQDDASMYTTNIEQWILARVVVIKKSEDA
jgi:uncharacterized membrane protein